MSSLHNQTGLGKRALVSLTAQQKEKGGLALSINYNYLYNCHFKTLSVIYADIHADLDLFVTYAIYTHIFFEVLLLSMISK